MSRTTIIKCDVCEQEKEVTKNTMQMLRNFDANDGRTFYKHLTIRTLEICKECKEQVLVSGRYLVDNSVEGFGDIEVQGED